MPSHDRPDGDAGGERAGSLDEKAEMPPLSETSSESGAGDSIDEPAPDRSRGGRSGELPNAAGPPQVSLLQVFAFAGLLSLSLAVEKAWFIRGADLTEIAWFIIACSSGSVSLTGLIFVARWFTTGRIARVQEGEWLLIAMGIEHAAWLLGVAWLDEFHAWPHRALLLSGVFLPPVFFAPVRWRLLFAFAALRESGYDSDIVGHELSGAAVTCVAVLTLLGSNVLLDCRREKRYRWSHWLGIVAYAAPVAWVAGMLVSLLIQIQY